MVRKGRRRRKAAEGIKLSTRPVRKRNESYHLRDFFLSWNGRVMWTSTSRRIRFFLFVLDGESAAGIYSITDLSASNKAKHKNKAKIPKKNFLIFNFFLPAWFLANFIWQTNFSNPNSANSWLLLSSSQREQPDRCQIQQTKYNACRAWKNGQGSEQLAFDIQRGRKCAIMEVG